MPSAPSKKPASKSVIPKGAPRSGGETHQQVAGGQAATAYLTTNHGTRISDNQNSLRLGARGPTLLEDFILREKIFFDADPLLKKAGIPRVDGVTGLDKKFVGAAGRRFFDREPSVRTLA